MRRSLSMSVDELNKGYEPDSEHLDSNMLGVEIFQRAKEAVTQFVSEQGADNVGLIGKWDISLAAALAERKIEEDSRENRPGFDFDNWNNQVREAIQSRITALHRVDSSAIENMSPLIEVEPVAVDQLQGIGSEVQAGYEGHRTQLSQELFDMWQILSRVDYVNQFPEGSNDRERLISLVNTLELFKNSEIIGGNPDSWGGKLIERLTRMMGDLEKAKQERDAVFTE